MLTRRSDVICCLVVSALCATGCGQASKVPSHPFVPGGGVEAGLTSGLWGDAGSGPSGMELGCMPNRHFAVLVTLRNRATAPVTVTGVDGEDPARPGVIRRVAVQVRLAPRSPRGGLYVPGLRSWSDASLVPVTVPPGRNAWVQSNFVMSDCRSLRPRASVTANRAIDVSFRAGGGHGKQRIAQRSSTILLSRGPTIRQCPPARGDVTGAHNIELRTLNLACGVARTVSAACCRSTHGRSGSTCPAAGASWACNWIERPRSRSVESCFVHTSSLRAVWMP